MLHEKTWCWLSSHDQGISKNADGGELFVGVEDDGTVTGILYRETQYAMLTEAYQTHIHADTPLPSPTVARVSYESKSILYFQVAKSTQRVHLTSDGRCLRRFDRENRPRLSLHQRRSALVMDQLHLWLEAQLAERRTEPNSGLGEAINYLLRHWQPLTLFLR